MTILAASAAAPYRLNEKGWLADKNENFALFSRYPSGEKRSYMDSLWDEKAGLAREDEKSNGLAGKPYSLSDQLNKNAFAQILDYLQAWNKSGCVSPRFEKRPVLVKEVVLAQPELSVVNSEAADIVSPLAKVNPLTVEYLQALQADLPGMYELLERRPPATGAAPYKLELKRLELFISKVIHPENPEDSASALVFTGFTAAQVDSIKDRVNALSTYCLRMTQSSQGLLRLPDLSNIKSLHALLVGTGYFIGALVACSMGVSIPALILASASFSLLGLIVFTLCDRFKASEDEEDNGDMNELVLFTKRFENLKDAAIMFSFAVQGEGIKQNTAAINSLGTNQQSQAQQIANLNDDLNMALQAINELKAELAAMKKTQDKAEEGQAGLSIEAQKTSNGLVSEKEAVIQLC